PYTSLAAPMQNSATLNVSYARESESPSAAFTAGMTGMNRWIASGPINEIDASARANSGPGMRDADGMGLTLGLDAVEVRGHARDDAAKGLPVAARDALLGFG